MITQEKKPQFGQLGWKPEPLESFSKTTQENSTARIKDLTNAIGYLGGITAPGAKALAMLIATLEVRITVLEDTLAAKAKEAAHESIPSHDFGSVGPVVPAAPSRASEVARAGRPAPTR